MKKILLILILLPCLAKAQSANYLALADSCNKMKDYACAATNYEAYLKTDDSNGVAYMAAKAWAMTGDKEKTFAALNVYVKNNALNNYTFFSNELLKDKNFDFIKNEQRWKDLIAAAQKEEARVSAKEKKECDDAKTNAKNFEAMLDIRLQLNQVKLSGDIYHALKTVLHYKSPNKYLTNDGITLFIRIDGVYVPFYVQLPHNYNPKVATPAMVVLHGAVRFNKVYGSAVDLPTTFGMTSDHIPYYSGNYIAIYPKGINTLNWMNTEKGFDMVNEIVIRLKAFLNIDDNRVELLGHSNGATGVFTYLVKSPTLYTGFYGMNTQPKVFIGGTFLQNGATRHFYNFATDKDYYYPPQAVKTIDSMANSLGVNWHTELNHGFPHWFPSMKESLLPMAKIFEDMGTRVRNPYPLKIYFETDDIKYGSSDWISITGLDTASNKATWQTDPNFKITEWLDNKDFNKTIHREEMAFDYPHKSGAIKAERRGNDIYVETSDVASFTIRLNRDMVDYGKMVNVYLNGKKVFSKKIEADKGYTLAEFKKGLDRKVVWENELSFKVK